MTLLIHFLSQFPSGPIELSQFIQKVCSPVHHGRQAAPDTEHSHQQAQPVVMVVRKAPASNKLRLRNILSTTAHNGETEHAAFYSSWIVPPVRDSQFIDEQLLFKSNIVLKRNEQIHFFFLVLSKTVDLQMTG